MGELAAPQRATYSRSLTKGRDLGGTQVAKWLMSKDKNSWGGGGSKNRARQVAGSMLTCELAPQEELEEDQQSHTRALAGEYPPERCASQLEKDCRMVALRKSRKA